MGEQGVKRACKYRFYPTADQAEQLLRTFGCVRKVYNLALQDRSQAKGLAEPGEGAEGGCRNSFQDRRPAA
jgi:transposase